MQRMNYLQLQKNKKIKLFLEKMHYLINDASVSYPL